MAQAYDAEAEKTFLRAILHGVEFVDLHDHIEPKMMYGQMRGTDWQPVLHHYIYQAVRLLYAELRAIPKVESVIAKLKSGRMEIASSVTPQQIAASVEKLYEAGAPDPVDAKDARIRIYQSFTFRHAGKVLEESLNIMKDTSDGEKVLQHMMEKAGINVSKTKDYEVSDYFASRQERVERIRAIQRGDDDSIKKIPFGIRGLDAETGGLSAGEVAIGLLGPGRGKTIGLIDSCANNVELGNNPVLFTKEMTNYEVSLRFDSRFTGIPHPKFYAASIEEREFTVWESKINAVAEKFRQQNKPMPLRIVTMKREFTVQRMREILMSLDWDYDVRVIYADYLGIMEPSDERDRRRAGHETGMIICDELKNLALERGNPIMTMSQLKPQSVDKLRITWDDVAISKQAISNYANVAFAILADEWLKAMGKAILQIMKLRAKSAEKEMWDMFPVHDLMRIDSNVHGASGHPAPQLQQSFQKNFVVTEEDYAKNKKPTVVVRGLDGSMLKPSLKPSTEKK
jgi:replicative DNA helicase